ncbi:MAG: hypothetical protein AB7I33_15315 [Gemmatimonadales bacterium]
MLPGVLAALTLTACGASSDGSAVIRVDSTRTFQTIDGWEASESFGWSLPPAMMDSLLRVAVNDLGITRLRLSAPGNMIESRDTVTMPEEVRLGTNDDDDPHHLNPAGFQWELFDRQTRLFAIPMKRLVEARGEPFRLVLTYVGFRPTSAFQQRNTPEYVEVIMAMLTRLRDTLGIVPDYFEPRLEPNNGRTVVTGTRLGELLVAARRAARADGFTGLRYVVPSTSVAQQAVPYLEALLRVPDAGRDLAEFSYHRYAPAGASVLTGIRDAGARHGLPTAMLEFQRGTEKELMEDLTLADVVAWSRFSLAGPYGGPEAGGQYFYVDPVAKTFRYRASTWPLRQFFHYVRPGAVRVEAATTNRRSMPAAFRRPDGRFVVVVNTRGGTLQFRGLQPGRYEVSAASPAHPPAILDTVAADPAGRLAVTVPWSGTITVAALR